MRRMEFLQAHPWLLALAIFASRVTDVSLGTTRTILVFRGYKWIAAGIAFVEVLLWVLAVGQVLKNLDQWYLAIAYAAGFATGNVLGMWLEGRLAMGTELVRAISASPEVALAERLRARSFHVTEIAGKTEEDAPVEILLVVERRRKVPELLRLIEEADPDAVCTLSDVRRHHPVKGGPRPGAGKRK